MGADIEASKNTSLLLREFFSEAYIERSFSRENARAEFNRIYTSIFCYKRLRAIKLHLCFFKSKIYQAAKDSFRKSDPTNKKETIFIAYTIYCFSTPSDLIAFVSFRNPTSLFSPIRHGLRLPKLIYLLQVGVNSLHAFADLNSKEKIRISAINMPGI